MVPFVTLLLAMLADTDPATQAMRHRALHWDLTSRKKAAPWAIIGHWPDGMRLARAWHPSHLMTLVDARLLTQEEAEALWTDMGDIRPDVHGRPTGRASVPFVFLSPERRPVAFMEMARIGCVPRTRHVVPDPLPDVLLARLYGASQRLSRRPLGWFQTIRATMVLEGPAHGYSRWMDEIISEIEALEEQIKDAEEVLADPYHLEKVDMATLRALENDLWQTLARTFEDYAKALRDELVYPYQVEVHRTAPRRWLALFRRNDGNHKFTIELDRSRRDKVIRFLVEDTTTGKELGTYVEDLHISIVDDLPLKKRPSNAQIIADSLGIPETLKNAGRINRHLYPTLVRPVVTAQSILNPELTKDEIPWLSVPNPTFLEHFEIRPGQRMTR